MLRVRRTSVTDVASKMQAVGAISHCGAQNAQSNFALKPDRRERDF